MKYITCCLTFEFELFFKGGKCGDWIAEKHGLEETEEAVDQQVRLFGRKFLQPFSIERT